MKTANQPTGGIETIPCERLLELMDAIEADENAAAKALAWWVSCGYEVDRGRGAELLDAYRTVKRRRSTLMKELSRRNSADFEAA